jgi:hypothetical protein
MIKISSSQTFIHKRVFPVAWFGFVTVFLVVGVAIMGFQKRFEPMMVVVPIFMLVVGYFVMRLLVFDLVDEVWDDGDALVVRNRGVEETIPLKDIINVNYSGMTNPQRVTLTLREPGPFGAEITFSPPRSWFPFKQPQLVTDLIQRIDEERRNASA